jgi:hypothetical protein
MGTGALAMTLMAAVAIVACTSRVEETRGAEGAVTAQGHCESQEECNTRCETIGFEGGAWGNVGVPSDCWCYGDQAPIPPALQEGVDCARDCLYSGYCQFSWTPGDCECGTGSGSGSGSGSGGESELF